MSRKKACKWLAAAVPAVSGKASLPLNSQRLKLQLWTRRNGH